MDDVETLFGNRKEDVSNGILDRGEGEMLVRNIKRTSSNGENDNPNLTSPDFVFGFIIIPLGNLEFVHTSFTIDLATSSGNVIPFLAASSLKFCTASLITFFTWSVVICYRHRVIFKYFVSSI